MTARRVLLVDDEQRLVIGLQRLLRPYREKWDVTTATSAAEALALMDASSFDAVVSDMRMPVMDGAEFLAIARGRHPATMRIVLSGQTDADSAIRALPVAHQFLSKPTAREELLDMLDRVATLQAEVSDPTVRDVLGSIDSLPAHPQACGELLDLLARGAPATTVEAHVRRDPALVAKVLQVVNSSLFGERRRFASIAGAIAHLGLDALRSLIGLVAATPTAAKLASRFDPAAFNQHAITVACMAERVAGEDPELKATCFAAGLLHDLGKLVLASATPERYEAIVARCDERGISFEQAEEELGGCAHNKLAASLLDLWGLPGDIVESVLHYPDAPACQRTELRGRDAVHVAHRLLDSGSTTFDGDAGQTYLERVRLVATLDEVLQPAPAAVAAA